MKADTITVTFRVPRVEFTRLREEAREKKVSLNKLVVGLLAEARDKKEKLEDLLGHLEGLRELQE